MNCPKYEDMVCPRCGNGEVIQKSEFDPKTIDFQKIFETPLKNATFWECNACNQFFAEVNK